MAVFLGGIIPDDDVQPLKDAGVRAIFGPGTNTDLIVQTVRAEAGR